MGVALRKESVDRNTARAGEKQYTGAVALRKESVDRNFYSIPRQEQKIMSLSARRAWIEIAPAKAARNDGRVALRKESVDRNLHQLHGSYAALRRSPQGERG